jgi:hypothetical protein
MGSSATVSRLECHNDRGLLLNKRKDARYLYPICDSSVNKLNMCRNGGAINEHSRQLFPM